MMTMTREERAGRRSWLRLLTSPWKEEGRGLIVTVLFDFSYALDDGPFRELVSTFCLCAFTTTITTRISYSDM